MEKSDKYSNGTSHMSNGNEIPNKDKNIIEIGVKDEVKQNEIIPGSKNDPFRWYRIGKQSMIIAAWISIVSIFSG